MDQSWPTISDAAAAMALSPRRVRALLESGELRGQKIAGTWLVDPADARRRSVMHRQPGRPLTATNAWLYLAALTGTTSTQPAVCEERDDPWPPDISAAIPTAVDRSRLRTQLARIPDSAGLARLLRSRADVRPMRAHPGVLDRLLDDSRVSAGAGRAVAAHGGGGIAGGGRPRIYVRDAALPALAATYRLVDDTAGNVDVAVIAADVPPAVLPVPGQPVPAAVGWLDVLDDPDSRARHAAHDWVASLPTRITVPDRRRRRT